MENISIDQLHDLEKLRDALVHMVVHDMRSPLQSLLGFLDLLKMSAHEKHTEDETLFLNNSISSADKLHEMIDSLLTLIG